MTMLVTSVCTACSKVNITVVNSGMVAVRAFYPGGWNILYSNNDRNSQAVCICSKICMQMHVNRTNSSNVWVEPDGSQEQIDPVVVH